MHTLGESETEKMLEVLVVLYVHGSLSFVMLTKIFGNSQVLVL